MGEGEDAVPVLHRSREGAATMAEELALHEAFGDGRAVQGDERLVAARTALVNGAGDELLARPALTHDAHVGVAPRDLVDLRENLSELLRLPDDPGVRVGGDYVGGAGRRAHGTDPSGDPIEPCVNAGRVVALDTIDAGQGREAVQSRHPITIDEDEAGSAHRAGLEVPGDLPGRELARQVHDDELGRLLKTRRQLELLERAYGLYLAAPARKPRAQLRGDVQRFVQDE